MIGMNRSEATSAVRLRGMSGLIGKGSHGGSLISRSSRVRRKSTDSGRVGFPQPAPSDSGMGEIAIGEVEAERSALATEWRALLSIARPVVVVQIGIMLM